MISDNQSILSMLKVYYAKEGVQNLLFRNSPVLKELAKTRVEGRVQNFNAMYGRGGAAGANFTNAVEQASSVSKNAEFSVVPGQLFSVYTMNAKEVLASKTNRGAYTKIAGAKMFAASESFRKTMAAALYGSGYGELCAAPTDAFTASTPKEVTLPDYAIMSIDIGSKLEVADAKNTASPKNTLEVLEINGNKVKVMPSHTNTADASDVLRLAGSVDSAGKPLLPVGLGGWLPVTKKRDGLEWTTEIGTPFFGVTRKVAADRLAGAFVAGDPAEKKIDTVTKLLKKVRRQGSAADMIVMNDNDWLEVSKEVELTNSYFAQTNAKGKKTANVGFGDLTFSFSTNWIENVIDDPYCPEGRFYILDKSAVEVWGYTNTDPLEDNNKGNEPGKDMEADGDGKENDPYALLIDDMINIQPGQNTSDGPASQVSLMFFGSVAVTNPSVCGVGEFDGTKDFACL